jgi:hypothetical protein
LRPSEKTYMAKMAKRMPNLETMLESKSYGNPIPLDVSKGEYVERGPLERMAAISGG